MVRIGELLGLTWDCVDISEEAISENRAYVFINKQVERVSKEAVEELDSKEVILIFPSQRKNNKTVRVLKTPKTDTSERKVYIPGFVAQCLIDIKKEQDEEALKDFWDYCEERQREERIIAEISNVGNREYEIKMGDKVGQLVIMPVLIPDFTFENWKEHGTGTFGSTGR